MNLSELEVDLSELDVECTISYGCSSMRGTYEDPIDDLLRVKDCRYRVTYTDEDENTFELAKAHVYIFPNLVAEEAREYADAISGDCWETFCGISANAVLNQPFEEELFSIWYLDNIEVDKDSRNQGIGTFLLQFILQENELDPSSAIILYANSYETKGKYTQRLINWYRKNDLFLVADATSNGKPTAILCKTYDGILNKLIEEKYMKNRRVKNG